MAVTKGGIWKDKDNKEYFIELGADAENVTINGEKLTKVIEDINTAIDSASIQKYSAVPQKIGIWIDGTPVWRVALPYIQMEHGVRQLMADETTHTIRVDIEELMKDYVNTTVNYSDLSILNMCINICTEYPSWLQPCALEIGKLYFAKDDVSAFDDYITYGNGRWGGYIEFAAPESNIKSTV